MEKTAKSNAPEDPPFCGLQPLTKRLKEIATAGNWHAFDEIYDAVEELQRLDNSLSRVRYDLSSIDKVDLDRAIDFWRKGV